MSTDVDIYRIKPAYAWSMAGFFLFLASLALSSIVDAITSPSDRPHAYVVDLPLLLLSTYVIAFYPFRKLKITSDAIEFKGMIRKTIAFDDVVKFRIYDTYAEIMSDRAKIKIQGDVASYWKAIAIVTEQLSKRDMISDHILQVVRERAENQK